MQQALSGQQMSAAGMPPDGGTSKASHGQDATTESVVLQLERISKDIQAVLQDLQTQISILRQTRENGSAPSPSTLIPIPPPTSSFPRLPDAIAKDLLRTQLRFQGVSEEFASVIVQNKDWFMSYVGDVTPEEAAVPHETAHMVGERTRRTILEPRQRRGGLEAQPRPRPRQQAKVERHAAAAEPPTACAGPLCTNGVKRKASRHSGDCVDLKQSRNEDEKPNGHKTDIDNSHAGDACTDGIKSDTFRASRSSEATLPPQGSETPETVGATTTASRQSTKRPRLSGGSGPIAVEVDDITAEVAELLRVRRRKARGLKNGDVDIDGGIGSAARDVAGVLAGAMGGPGGAWKQNRGVSQDRDRHQHGNASRGQIQDPRSHHGTRLSHDHHSNDPSAPQSKSSLKRRRSSGANGTTEALTSHSTDPTISTDHLRETAYPSTEASRHEGEAMKRRRPTAIRPLAMRFGRSSSGREKVGRRVVSLGRDVVMGGV